MRLVPFDVILLVSRDIRQALEHGSKHCLDVFDIPLVDHLHQWVVLTVEVKTDVAVIVSRRSDGHIDTTSFLVVVSKL